MPADSSHEAETLMIVPFPSGTQYGSTLEAKQREEDHGGDFVAALKEYMGAAPAESERLDVAKFIFMCLVVVGHFSEPFYLIGNKYAGTLMHCFYAFHIPAFVLVSGYVSGELDSRRRKQLITGLLIPYLILQFIYSYWYSVAYFWSAGPNTTAGYRREPGEMVKGWKLYDQEWNSWTFGWPFAHLWYIMSLMQKRIWRPFAMELHFPVLVHVFFGALIGYTDIGRFLSLHRTIVHMPYFLAGYQMKRYGCFFPYASSVSGKVAAHLSLAFIIVVGFISEVKHLPLKVWFQSDPHADVFLQYRQYGGLFQLCCYLWTMCTMITAFSLIPRPADVGVKKQDVEAHAAGATRLAARALEADQETIFAKAYLRMATWGSRSFFSFVLHIAVMMIMEHVGYFEVTYKYQSQGNNPIVTVRFFLGVLVALGVNVLLLQKPVEQVFTPILQPNVDFLFTKTSLLGSRSGAVKESSVR